MSAWTQCVKRTAKKHPGLKGPKLFRKASEVYKSMKGSKKSKGSKTHKRIK